MANIGATTAFYKVESSLTRANNEVSKSMERLATGKQNANAGDRSSFVAMADTFRLDYVGTKAGIKGASVAMGYLETGMRTLDAASALLSRLQELAVLGANATNTDADHEAINLEAEAIADEFNRLMSTSTYKGKPLFVSAANSEYVSLGGRDAEMTFGIEDLTDDAEYTALYDATPAAGNAEPAHGGPNAGDSFNLMIKPSDAVDSKIFGMTGNVFQYNVEYRITDLGAAGSTLTTDLTDILSVSSDLAATSDVYVGKTFTADATDQATLNAITDIDQIKVQVVSNTNALTSKIEALQAKINTARVQAGSQYAALESAVSYTTDLTAQYELGYNTVNDVNFSMETAHLAKNQILQQAATAMLAQANTGQQSLLQLIQG